MFKKLLRLFNMDSLIKEVKERTDAQTIHVDSDESITPYVEGPAIVLVIPEEGGWN